MYISLYDLGLLILFILAITAFYYLIVALKGIIGVVRQVRNVIDDNQESIARRLRLCLSYWRIPTNWLSAFAKPSTQPIPRLPA